MLTTIQVAAELGVSRYRVWALIKAGRLRATKVGRDLLIDPADVDAVRVRKAGWKKGVPRGPRPPRPKKRAAKKGEPKSGG